MAATVGTVAVEAYYLERPCVTQVRDPQSCEPIDECYGALIAGERRVMKLQKISLSTASTFQRASKTKKTLL